MYVFQTFLSRFELESSYYTVEFRNSTSLLSTTKWTGDCASIKCSLEFKPIENYTQEYYIFIKFNDRNASELYNFTSNSISKSN